MKRVGVHFLMVLVLGPPVFCQNNVNLSWQASSDAASNPSLTYNIYRAPTCAGPFARLNGSGISTTSYVDPAVASGATYCYQVTAVLSGTESMPSNPAIAAVPPPANRQRTCAHGGPLIGWIRCVGSRVKGSGSKPFIH